MPKIPIVQGLIPVNRKCFMKILQEQNLRADRILKQIFGYSSYDMD